MVTCLSGRGDKDLETVLHHLAKDADHQGMKSGEEHESCRNLVYGVWRMARALLLPLLTPAVIAGM